MKYLCLVYGEEQAMASIPDRDCVAWGEALKKRGQYLAAESLQPTRTAQTVRVRGGKAIVTDGPFTEAKEFLAGFYLIDAADMEEAVEIASKIPPARAGSVEVRPVRDLQPR